MKIYLFVTTPQGDKSFPRIADRDNMDGKVDVSIATIKTINRNIVIAIAIVFVIEKDRLR